MTAAGHNSVSPDQLRSIVDRILRLKDEQDDLGGDVKEVYAEAHSNGYDKTAIGQVVGIIRKKRKDPAAYAERSAIVDLYLTNLGETDEPVARTRMRAREIIEELSPDQPADEPRVAPPRVADTTAPAGRAADESPATYPDDGSLRPDLEIPAGLRRAG